ncbi:MAG: exodeoxyribonuclease VII small subunit [Clostridia bacterium]|nr:exodeoxyribonuclease VII small subunit [Clostridia bacterium]
MKKEMTFEAAIIRLEEIVGLLETGDAPLDESMKLFGEGSRLAAFCAVKLRDAEQAVVKISGGKNADDVQNGL